MNVSHRFVVVAAVSVTCLITANIIAVKPISLGISLFGLPASLPAAIVIFPVSYIFGDILTEVYGYRQARRVIWLGSFLAYIVGEFSNSFVLAKMKIMTKGRWLWTRTIGSTIVGQGFDSAIFITIVYIGRFELPFITITIFTHWLVKTGYETVATPFTYAVVNFLKKKEAIDTYDYETNFNPFRISG